MHPKTIGIIAHTGKPGVGDLVNAIAEEFSRFSMTPLLEKETARIAGKKSEYSIAELGAATDLLVVAGGDGTILRVVGPARRGHKADFRHQRGLARFPDHRKFCDLSRGGGMPGQRSDQF